MFIVSNLDIIWFNLKTFEFFSLVNFEQVFYQVFFVWKSLFHFFVVVVYYNFLQEQLHSNVAAKKICGTVVVLEIHRKLTCGSSLPQLTGLHQGDLLEMFKEKNLGKVGFSKLLTKENLLVCFH